MPFFDAYSLFLSYYKPEYQFSQKNNLKSIKILHRIISHFTVQIMYKWNLSELKIIRKKSQEKNFERKYSKNR